MQITLKKKEKSKVDKPKVYLFPNQTVCYDPADRIINLDKVAKLQRKNKELKNQST